MVANLLFTKMQNANLRLCKSLEEKCVHTDGEIFFCKKRKRRKLTNYSLFEFLENLEFLAGNPGITGTASSRLWRNWGNFCNIRTLRSSTEESWNFLEKLGLLLESFGRIGGISANSGLKEAILKDSEWSWKLLKNLGLHPENSNEIGEFIPGFPDRCPGLLNFLVGILDFLDNLPWSCKILGGF